jgi:tetratricopeptide (TPR) repeat protein
MTDANAASVIDVCRRLEGIPLAIEMAAARASSLGVAALASLMGQQLDILVADRPGLPQRQRTLRATLEWSHRLLRPLEKVVLRRLGVFAGGFSLDLMLDVVPAATEETERWAVLDAFASLVDRSLVWVDPGNPPRYRLLESINAFALERLAEAGETAALFARHALTMRKVYAAIFATRMQHFDNAMSLLKRDLDNARTALRWALENDPETALVLAAPLRSVDEAMSLSNAPIWSQTEALMSPAVPVAIRADWTLAACKRRQGDIGYSARMADEAVRLFREAGDPSGVQEALFQAVGARLVLGDAAGHARALAEFRSLDGVARPPGIRWRRLSVEGMVLMGMGRAEEALAIYDRTLEIIPSAGDQYAEWLLRFGIIDAELASGKIERAVAHADALVSQERSGGSQLRLVLSLLSFSSALLERGDCARARSVLVEAWPMCVIYDLQLYASEQLALLAALEGRAHACACLIGHADATRSAQPGVRDSTEQRAMARASNLARALIGPAAFDKVLSQGVVLVDAAIASIGFDEGEAT